MLSFCDSVSSPERYFTDIEFKLKIYINHNSIAVLFVHWNKSWEGQVHVPPFLKVNI